mmetsp:Transcript_924/g.2300  ORF Transcript_924/g.2300 Transcript_924/m.2300 type:complete len:195 (-) Transcript_924:98-682(-)
MKRHTNYELVEGTLRIVNAFDNQSREIPKTSSLSLSDWLFIGLEVDLLVVASIFALGDHCGGPALGADCGCPVADLISVFKFRAYCIASIAHCLARSALASFSVMLPRTDFAAASATQSTLLFDTSSTNFTRRSPAMITIVLLGIHGLLNPTTTGGGRGNPPSSTPSSDAKHLLRGLFGAPTDRIRAHAAYSRF